MASTRILLASSARRRNHSRSALLLLAALAAGCGGGGGGPPASPSAPVAPAPETLFIADNRWNGPAPADSESVTPDEFRRLQTTGELEIVTPLQQEAQQAQRLNKFETNRAFLESKTDLSDDVIALLAESRAATGSEAGPIITLADGRQIGLMDVGSRIEKAAESYSLARDPEAARASYQLSYSLLTDELKTQVPAPSSLSSSSLDEIKAATLQLDSALSSMIDLDGTRLDPEAPVMPQGVFIADQSQKTPTPGNGMDTAGACAATGLAQRYWFPLRAFVSPIKNQGTRGTCWAFSAVAAVESRERVQNDNAADLSEQFLVNKVKREWFPDEFGDGGSAAAGLNAAVDRNQPLLPEPDWTYNTATSRPGNAFASGVAGTAASYVGACNGYTGTCSETAHQSRRFCTSVNGESFCGYDTTAFGGPGIAASRVRQIWSSGEAFNLNQYRALLSSGASLIASFPVYEGFSAAPNGVVSDYAKQMRDAKNELVDGTYGGHLVQIVGFITNEQLSFPGFAPSAIGGGGYFIVRNSWGCAGDGGYYYVPADYVSTLFSTLEVLDFDASRSTRWNDEQVTPGGASGLMIDPRGTSGVDLRVQSNLASLITVAHPTANYARLTVTSDRDGLLFDGQWLMNPPVGGSLFANALPVNFQTEGLRTLTLTARYGTQVVTATKGILVLNSPPTIELQSTGTPQQGESFVVNAIVTDRNDANPVSICNAMTWSVTAPDTIVSGSGCERVIRFGTTGSREVRAASQDMEGRAGSTIGTFTVAPPPVNPYPRITTFGVYSRDPIMAADIFVGCRTNQVGNYAVIDLREIGCSIGLAQPSRYLSQLTIENPEAESLSYDWTYSAYAPAATTPAVTAQLRTTTPSFDLQPLVFGFLNTPYRCTVDVRVNAPQASRNKSQRVWSGDCILIQEGPR